MHGFEYIMWLALKFLELFNSVPFQELMYFVNWACKFMYIYLSLMIMIKA